MQLKLNGLIQFSADGKTTRTERILRTEYSGDTVYLFEMGARNAWPRIVSRRALETEFKLGTATMLVTDPFADLCRSEDDIDAQPRPDRKRLKSYQAHRDAVYAKLKPALTGEWGDCLDPCVRPGIIVRLVKDTGWCRQTVVKYLRRWWECGQLKNALLPRYHNSGGPGKRRIGQADGKKRGRPNNSTKQGHGVSGRNATPEDIQWIETGVMPLFETLSKPDFATAYQDAVKHQYGAEQFTYDAESGLHIPQRAVPAYPPSLDQAIYYCEKALDRKRQAKKRHGPLAFPLEYRHVLGDSSGMMVGPGAVYQIDATIGDVYLVSSIDRKRIIGRPVIYVVMDVFSRLVAGFAVALEGPSWEGAKQALLNAYEDKTALAAQYGLPFTATAWPSRHLPNVLLADNGELLGLRADELQAALGIAIQNPPVSRGDWKGIVERHFRLVKENLRWIPGFVYDLAHRRGPDYRFDAVLTLQALRKLLILCFATYNSTHRLTDYALSPAMIEDGVGPYPAQLWRWGMQNSCATPRQLSDERVAVTLLPTGEATITPRGLAFRGMHYTCALAEQAQWFIRYQRRKGRIPVAWDPRCPKTIYLRLNSGRDIVACHLVDRAKEKNFAEADWHEIMDYAAVKHTQDRQAVLPDLRAQVPYDRLAEEIVAKETELSRSAQAGHSHRSRLAGMKAARQVEAAMDTSHSAPGFSLLASGASPNVDADDDYIPPALHEDVLQLPSTEVHHDTQSR